MYRSVMLWGTDNRFFVVVAAPARIDSFWLVIREQRNEQNHFEGSDLDFVKLPSNHQFVCN